MKKNKKNHIVKNSQAGFTLIELMTVISILTLLSSIITAQVKIARDRAYDTRRAVDAATLQKGVELYYQDNGSYPASTVYPLVSEAPEWNSDFGPKLVGNYLQAMPQTVRPNLETISAFSLVGTFLFYRGATVREGQTIFTSIDSVSGHYGQALMLYQGQYGCFRKDSYFIAMYQAIPDPGSYTSIMNIGGVKYGVNKVIMGGNYVFPFTGDISTCPSSINP